MTWRHCIRASEGAGAWSHRAWGQRKREGQGHGVETIVKELCSLTLEITHICSSEANLGTSPGQR